MNDTVYIRPIELHDALVSCHWRNNPRIWRFTGAKPDKYITPEMETAWLAEVLQRENEKRFAICLVSDNKYIGNVFLTDIQSNEGQIHIFIGEMEFWGKNRAFDAICMIMDYGFNTLKLEIIYALINPKNHASLSLSKILGFTQVSEYYDEGKGMMLEKFILIREIFDQNVHLYRRKMTGNCGNEKTVM